MISHKDVMGKLSPERRARIQARADRAVGEIRALREKLGIAQEERAERPSVHQSAEVRLVESEDIDDRDDEALRKRT